MINIINAVPAGNDFRASGGGGRDFATGFDNILSNAAQRRRPPAQNPNELNRRQADNRARSGANPDIGHGRGSDNRLDGSNRANRAADNGATSLPRGQGCDMHDGGGGQSHEAVALDDVNDLNELCPIAALLEVGGNLQGVDIVLAELAAVLGISVLALVEILHDMDMSLDELKSGQGQVALLKAINGVQSDVELLELPDIADIMQKLDNVMQEYENGALSELGSEHGLEHGLEREPGLDGRDRAPIPEPGAISLGAQPMQGRRIELRAGNNGSGLNAQPMQLIGEYSKIPIIELGQAAALNSELVQVMARIEHDGLEPGNEPLLPDMASAIQEEQTLPTAMLTEPAIELGQVLEVPANVLVNNNAPQVAQPAHALPVNQPQAPINPQNVMEQIVNHMRFEVRGDMAEIRIMLKPEYLGEVSMRIATQNGIVTAHFVAESQRVKEIIEAGFSHLRDALEEQGINIADIDVSVAGDNSGDAPEYEGRLSSARIRDIMAAAMDEEAENLALEENILDYRV